MDLTFFTLFENGILTRFGAAPLRKEYKVVSCFFSSFVQDGLEEYKDVLSILHEIDQGKISYETWPLRDSVNASLWMDKEICVFTNDESYEELAKVEMPTAEFKALLLKWMKFIEVNTAEFYK